MIKYECDRCHKDFDDLNGRRVMKIFRDGERMKTYDLCPECQEAVCWNIEHADIRSC